MTPPQDAGLPVVRAADLAGEQHQTRWLIENLWAPSAVGIVGGPPKCGKTWLALDMAVSLASGTPCLGAYSPVHRGRVLLYAAEDAQSTVRQRLEAICRHRKLSLADQEIYAITADSLRLDLTSDQKRLQQTVQLLKPDLLLLDPLVRLHRIDENNAGEVSTLLAYLRCLQREHQVAIALVHHTRKNGYASQPGQALRGSSDLHAFGDCNLYLRRKQDQLVLTVEHRAAPSPQPVEVRLVDGDDPHLEAVGLASKPNHDLPEAILCFLAEAKAPVTRTALRDHLKARNERLGNALVDLEQRRLIERTPTGWQLHSNDASGSNRSLSLP